MISIFLKILGLLPWVSKVLSRSQEQFLLMVGQNNFGNKIPFFCRTLWTDRELESGNDSCQGHVANHIFSQAKKRRYVAVLSLDPTQCKNLLKPISCSTWKKRPKKVAHNWPRPFYFHSPAQTTDHSPELIFHITAERKLERLQFSTSSLFVKIWSACSGEFKAYFWTFWALYHLLFDLETIEVN